MKKITNANELLAILEMLPSHIYWLDTENRICGCNKEQALAAGFQTPEEMIGKTDYDMPWREFADKIVAVNNKVMKQKIHHTVEEEVFLPDGQRIVYLSTKMPRYNEKNQVIGILGISIDITERKKMEEEMRMAKEKAEAANYIRTELIANLGHDLATPLSDMGSVVQMLLLLVDEYPELKELIEMLAKRCDDCVQVRQKFIDATSISKLDINIERFSISVELLKLEKELKLMIGSKNLKLAIHPLKPFKEDFIETDRVKFSTILRELISNAIEFTDEGEISITTTKSDDSFYIEVTDTGIGIPDDKFDYIFKQYTKLSRSNKFGATFKGVGAGLYLVTILLNLLRGTISVKSEVGKGSTFTVTIPERFSKK